MTTTTTLTLAYRLPFFGNRFRRAFFLLPFLLSLQLAAQTCPTIGGLDGPSASCEDFPFTLTAIWLQNTSAADNGDQDYDIDFVYLDNGSTADPYIDGVLLGTETPVDGEARLYEVDSELPIGSYDIYAILNPAPADASCRPSQMITLDVTSCDDFGDFTFLDFNNNGTYDGDDVPLPQVDVYLYNADTDSENLDYGPTTSNIDGNFWYSVIPPGNYFLGFEPPAGYTAAATASSFGNFNNRIDPSAGNGSLSTADFFFAAMSPDYTFDAGFIGPGTISGLVWADDDFDFNANETGTNNVSFRLDWHGPDGEWNTTDDVSIDQTSTAGGTFNFPNLPYGEYSLTLIDVTGTILADGYDLQVPTAVSYDFVIDADNTAFTTANFIFQPQCLPSTATLQTNDALIMCGNETLGIYADQIIRVALNNFTAPASISDDYDYHVLVVNEAGIIVKNYPVLNPATGIAVNVDLTGLPIGDYGIHGLHYLTTDPDLLGALDLSIGAPIQAVLDRLTNIDGNTNPIITADVCGDISLNSNNLIAAMNPQPPVTLGCLGLINVSLDSDCAATVSPQMVLLGDWGCLIPSDFRIDIFQDGQLISSDGQLSGCGTYTYEAHLLVDGIGGFPCWGTINARDVSAPVLGCPADITGGDNPEGNIDFLCSDIERLKLNVPSAYIVDGQGNVVDINPTLAAKLDVTGYPSLLDGCDFVRVYVSDVIEENGDCGDMAILRTFFAEDKYNSICSGTPNLSNICTQRITFRMPEIDDLVLPPNVIELDCAEFSGEVNPSPEEIANALDVLAYPAVFSYFDADPSTAVVDPHLINQVYCTLGASYQDLARVHGCGNTYTFIRSWTIYDKCDLSSFEEFNQFIKVKDTTDPNLELPTVDYDQDGFPDVRRYSTAPYDCQAYIIPPSPLTLSDFCSGPPSLVITVRDIDGTFIFSGTEGQLFTAPPGNYNIEYCAADNCDNEICEVMPIIVRDDIEPSMVCDDNLTVQLGGGDIANGQEGVARIFATNVDEGSNDNCSSTVNLQVRRNYWQNDDCGLSSSQYSPWGEDILFYCCDIGRSVTIELMATDEVGNSNTCWLTIVPEDKLKPFCYAPANQTVSCAELPNMISGDLEDGYANDFQATSIMMSNLFGGPTGTDNCALDTLVERTPTININACGWGSIVRRFEAWQLLPEGDVNGNNIIEANEVLISTNTCSQTITITETHEYLIDFPADASADCLDPDIPTLLTEAGGCDNLVINISEPQRFSATGDECYKLSITYDIINWCIWDGESDAYTVARQTDTDNSEVDPCERPVVRVNDDGAIIDRNHPENGCSSGLDNNFEVPANQDIGRWQYTQFVKVYDSSMPTFTIDEFGGPTPECPDLAIGDFPSLDNTLCTGSVQIDFSLADICEVFDNNGNLVLSITDANIDFAATDANLDGQIDANEFNAEQNVSNQIISHGDGSFSFSTTAPVIYLSQTPNVYHTVLIEAIDGCGNPAAQYISFRVIDCKAPAPICNNGLTATLTPTVNGGCEAAIWASDFLASPISDCSEPIGYALYRASEVLEAGLAFVPSPADTGLVLNMGDEGTLPVYVYAIDGEGNFGFCETYVQVQVSFSCIALGAIGGMVMTEEEEPIVGARMSLSGPTPMTTYSEADGSYLFDDLEEDFDYTVTAYRNDDPRNGVTTFDIVLISKHILALQPLNTPYKRIAADVNKSGTVTTLDIIHIRKLILNITDEFPNNTSWRFIDQNYTFPQPDNPWVEFFPELINLNDLIGEELDAGFIGVKIGDVNGSATGGM